MQRLLDPWRLGCMDIAALAPVERLYCECSEPEPIIRECSAQPPKQAVCGLRWLAVRVETAEPQDTLEPIKDCSKQGLGPPPVP